jgi:hypothetical protein
MRLPAKPKTRALTIGFTRSFKNIAVDAFVTGVIRGETPLLQKRSASGLPLYIAANTPGVS